MKYTDQTGRSISLNKVPERIISIVPSQTELLADLGLDKEVIGITKFCVHPAAWHRSKTRVGGTKNLNTGLIHELSPDLIIANKEENTREQIEELAMQFPVWISDVNDLPTACNMIEQVGIITGKESSAITLINRIRQGFGSITNNAVGSTVYLIWKDPYMTVGGDTFIHAMLESAGFKNAFADKKRYPAITLEEIELLTPSLVFLSSEPYPFREKHIAELQSRLPKTRIELVDGEIFSWYGSRMQYIPAYLTELKMRMGL